MRHRRQGRFVAVSATALLVVVALAVIGVLEGDLPDFVDASMVAEIVEGKGYIGAIGLLYLEESGVPMPVPGDIFVMYIGRQTAAQPLLLLAAWLALIATVVAGSSNLYLLARRFGRQWADGRPGQMLHLTPERLARAEQVFKRWGILAIIFGRHIPGFRVPITIAAGTLQTRYSTFAASVAVSTAAWAGFYLLVGLWLGPHVSDFLQAHRWTYFAIVALVVIAIGYIVFRVVKIACWSFTRPLPSRGFNSRSSGHNIPTERLPEHDTKAPCRCHR